MEEKVPTKRKKYVLCISNERKSCVLYSFYPILILGGRYGGRERMRKKFQWVNFSGARLTPLPSVKFHCRGGTHQPDNSHDWNALIGKSIDCSSNSHWWMSNEWRTKKHFPVSRNGRACKRRKKPSDNKIDDDVVETSDCCAYRLWRLMMRVDSTMLRCFYCELSTMEADSVRYVRKMSFELLSHSIYIYIYIFF